jgi:predicted dinucleotide-binding enzyme
MARHLGAIIIGTGQGGPFLARRLTAAGVKVTFRPTVSELIPATLGELQSLPG